LSFRVIIVLLILSNLLSAKDCGKFSDNSVEFALERNSLSGYVDIKDDNLSKLETTKDLNLKNIKNSLTALLFKDFKKHSFSFKVNHYKYQGESRLSHNIIQNSLHNATSSMVKNEIDLKWAKASYRYKMYENLQIGADFHGLSAYTQINGKSYRKLLFLPAIGVDYDYELEDDLKLITKTSATLTTDSRHYSLYTGLSFDLGFSNCTSLNIGYQHQNLIIDDKRLKSNLKFDGVYAGIAVKF
jgi:hypothetical protein